MILNETKFILRKCLHIKCSSLWLSRQRRSEGRGWIARGGCALTLAGPAPETQILPVRFFLLHPDLHPEP